MLLSYSIPGSIPGIVPRSIAGLKFPTQVLRRSVDCSSYFYFRGRERSLLYHEACTKWLSDENPTSSTSEVMDFCHSLVPTMDQ